MKIEKVLDAFEMIKNEGDEENSNSMSFIVAREGVMDKEGDVFAPGSLSMDRDKGTLVSFQHNNTPAGVFTLRKEGGNIIADAEFLDTEIGQDVRKYIKAMGDSAQFSFRATVQDYDEQKEGGYYIKKAVVYETSPVLTGAGDTELVSIKAQKVDGKMSKIEEVQNTELAQVLEAQKESNESTLTVVKSVSDVMKTTADTMIAVKDSLSKKEEPKAAPALIFNMDKGDNPIQELSKAMFGNQEVMDRIRNNNDGQTGVIAEKSISEVGDLVKASINSFHTIQAAPARPLVTTPIGALDVSYILPWPKEVFRRRQIERTLPESLVRTANSAQPSDTSSGGGVDSDDFNLRTIIATVPISNLSMMADPSVMASYVEMMIMDLRVATQAQMLAGNNTQQNLPGLVMQTNAGTAAVATTKEKILTDLLYPTILDVRAAGGAANYVFANGADVGKIYTSLTNQRSPFIGTLEFPYGAPMGASVILSPQMPANTMLVASMGEPIYHVLPIMGSFKVEVFRETNAKSDETLLRATVYVQNVIQDPKAFHKITATNLAKAE